MKKTIKLTIIMLISLILILNIPLYSSAVPMLPEDLSDGGGTTSSSEPPQSLDGIIGNANSFLSIGNGTGGINVSNLTGVFNMISGVLLTIATGITTISAVVMGINFTIQSVEDKAKIKESMVPWVIGIIISFGAWGIWRITIKVFMGL